jgi:hypothetical protein
MIRIKPHYKGIPFGPGRLQVTNMAYMQKIKAAIGKNDLLACSF